jgi:glucosamine-6-phosphate deaminase
MAVPLALPVAVTTPLAAAREAAGEIASLIRARDREGRGVVLGVATGRTPLELYDELARLHREEGLDFANVTAFALDEYLGLRPDDRRSFRSYLHERFAARVGLELARCRVPRSDLAPREVAEHCAEYERAIAALGGIDLQVAGLGRNGHVGFNEPGSPADSRTREVELAPETREAAAAAFGGLERVPHRAITVGIATLLAAKRLRVLAFGEPKREAVRAMLGAPPGAGAPAAFLRAHPDLKLFVDAAACGEAGGRRGEGAGSRRTEPGTGRPQ